MILDMQGRCALPERSFEFPINNIANLAWKELEKVSTNLGLIG